MIKKLTNLAGVGNTKKQMQDQPGTEGRSVVYCSYISRILILDQSYTVPHPRQKASEDFNFYLMAFFKKMKKKINGLWYPQSVTVGKPVTTDEVARRLAEISTVSPSDTYAVLKGLGSVLASFMAEGRTVKLDGVGTFYYTASANGQGVDSADKVTASQITGIRVRFIPESNRNSSGQVTTRSMVDANIFWEEWGGKSTPPVDPGGNEGEDPAV